jgi:hypothetical protein
LPQFVLRPLQPSSLRYFGTAPTNDFTARCVDCFARQRAPIAGFSTSSLALFPVSSFVSGADTYADYRESLLSMDICKKQIYEYCKAVGLPGNADDFINLISNKLIGTANQVDLLYPVIKELLIDKKGRPVLKKRGPKKRPASAIWLDLEIKKRMPERNILDILCNSHHYSD